jgi:hypothetical protein
VTPRPPAACGGRLIPAPLRQDPADGLGLCGRDPALHVDQAALLEALAVAALFVSVA